MLGTQQVLNNPDAQRRAPSIVQALHTYSSLAPIPTSDLYFCVPASKTEEGWRVPAKGPETQSAGWCQRWAAPQERASSQYVRSPPCLPPAPRVSPGDTLPSPLVCRYSKIFL